MATDPVPYLVVPRVFACLVMTPVLTIYSNMLGVFGGYVITVGLYSVSAQEYWDFSAQFINWWEPTSGLIKSFFFGGIIGLIACYRGFHATAGAAGVGRAATEAFVASFLAIIMINLLLAHVLNEVGRMFVYTGMGDLF
jgi:phospholipid/cholesterol/gamma-HCH transport system permease protein